MGKAQEKREAAEKAAAKKAEKDAKKAALKEAQLHANAPAWAKLMQKQLMDRMECIEKHMDTTLLKIVRLLEKENGGKTTANNHTDDDC